MPHSSLLPPPSPTLSSHNFVVRDAPDSDADTASQRSISLSSPPASPRHSSSDPRLSFASLSDPRQSFASASDPRQSFASSNPRQSFATSASSGSYSHAAYTDELDPFAPRETPDTSAAPSIYDEPSSYYKPDVSVLPTYPPPHRDDSISISSFASGSSRKTRPESLLVTPLPGKLVLGIALVDFNHLVFPPFLLCVHLCIVFNPGRDLFRSAQGLSTREGRFLMTKRWRRSCRFSLCLMGLIWCVHFFLSRLTI